MVFILYQHTATSMFWQAGTTHIMRDMKAPQTKVEHNQKILLLKENMIFHELAKRFYIIKKRAKEIYYRKLKKQQLLHKSWIFSHQQGRLDRICRESEMNNYK